MKVNKIQKTVTTGLTVELTQEEVDDLVKYLQVVREIIAKERYLSIDFLSRHYRFVAGINELREAAGIKTP